jgi:hypothetical protein
MLRSQEHTERAIERADADMYVQKCNEGLIGGAHCSNLNLPRRPRIVRLPSKSGGNADMPVLCHKRTLALQQTASSSINSMIVARSGEGRCDGALSLYSVLL